MGTLGIALDILDDGFEPVHILDGIATVGTFSGTGTVPGLVWGVSRMTWLTSDMVNGVFDWFGLNF